MDLVEIEALARSLIKEHNPHIKFQWSNTKNFFGDYYPDYKMIRLSKVLAPYMSDEQVRTVILHEIAHSLCTKDEFHGPYWQQLMRNKFNLPPDPCTEFSGDWYQVPGMWYGVCPNGHKAGVWARKPTKVRSCCECSQTYCPEYKISYERTPLVTAV